MGRGGHPRFNFKGAFIQASSTSSHEQTSPAPRLSSHRCASRLIEYPMPRTFLTASWRKLIMAQYAVSPATLAPWLPPGVELDLYKNVCYVSLVGFLFDRVRVLGLPIPLHTRFEEVKLRFYVASIAPDGTRRRGVVFVREFVPRAAITVIANSLYEEPYATLPMRHDIVSTPAALKARYEWRSNNRWHNLAAEASPTPQAMAPDSEEEFITEHYFGYTKRARGTTSEYAVQHPRWQVYPIRSFSIDADFAALYGPAFASLNSRLPDSILLAEGSAVSVSAGTRLTA
jgi:uncharacterized protein